MSSTPIDAPSDALVALARACGISTEYRGHDGNMHQCSPTAMRAAIAALELDASDDAACARSLDELEDHVWRRIVPPVTVVRQGHTIEVPVHVVDGDKVEVTLRLESGENWSLEQLDRYVPPRTIGTQAIGRATFQLPGTMPLGWHRLEATTSGRRGRGWVVVTPERLELSNAVRSSRPWGFTTQLYSIRSARSWGLGDYSDLGELCALAKLRAGADFVLVNPLHACEPVAPIEPSPYLPTSRRFLSPLYIRVEDIAEVAYVPSQQRAVIEWEAEKPRRANTTADLIDRDSVWRAKSQALEQIYQVERSPGRQAQFEAFCLREGKALEDFATWCAIAEAHKGLPWPHELDSPLAPAVTAWRDENTDRVVYFAWLQWVADEQLERAQASARAAQMSIGVMTDLAVGVHPEGADAWALQRVLARGMSVGAPPDMYNQQGQNWSQPPWQPRALEAAGYLPFRDVVRAAVRHCGALRIDHVIGMFRQWWIPMEAEASDGVYVQFNHEALIGIAVLEAHRAGAIVIGEDLGTVEPWVSDYLASRGILGTSVVWFEKEGDGRAKRPEHYRADALACVSTHDLPPTAAYLAGEHVTLREELGLLTADPDVLLAEARAERGDMVELLQERGWVSPHPTDEEIIGGLNTLVMNTPSSLVGVAITDGVGERRTQNQPGTFTEYPNWQIPLCDGEGNTVLLDELFDHPRMRHLVDVLRDARQ
ncbi:4-alpha-glucanotransferase [Demequina sp.]|uniref:4-alpha-glucanotransferase n=1 Tax=Demequina sp. TaxID=2050685 RepID=UPI003D0AA0E6